LDFPYTEMAVIFNTHKNHTWAGVPGPQPNSFWRRCFSYDRKVYVETVKTLIEWTKIGFVLYGSLHLLNSEFDVHYFTEKHIKQLTFAKQPFFYFLTPKCIQTINFFKNISLQLTSSCFWVFL
jgi:hypothetical protein